MHALRPHNPGEVLIQRVHVVIVCLTELLALQAAGQPGDDVWMMFAQMPDVGDAS